MYNYLFIYSFVTKKEVLKQIKNIYNTILNLNPLIESRRKFTEIFADVLSLYVICSFDA